jgi:hypothetical protein
VKSFQCVKQNNIVVVGVDKTNLFLCVILNLSV